MEDQTEDYQNQRRRQTTVFSNAFKCSAAQRAKFSEKVHKPSLGVNVINFGLFSI